MQSPAAIAMILIVGCSRGPSAPAFPEIKPEVAATEALRLYDLDGDGLLVFEEMAACPSVANASKRLDRDGNGSLTKNEIQDRLQQLLDSGTSLVGSVVQVTFDGKPLEGAKVIVEPEPFLGDGYESASGTTDETGMVSFKGHDPVLPGLHLGFYRVRISKLDSEGTETIPSEYNTESNLGVEVAADKGNLAIFKLASR